MCLSCEIHDKWPPFIEFVVWFILQGISVGNHFGVWVVLQSHIVDITNSTYRNRTYPNITTTRLPTTLPLNTTALDFNLTSTPASPSLLTEVVTTANMSLESFENITATGFPNFTGTIIPITNLSKYVIDQTPEEQWATLLDFREILLVFCIIGATIYVLHAVMLIPNIIQSCRVNDPLSLKDTGNAYFRNRLKVHALMLVLETIVFDIPAGCLTMEILSLIWEGPLSQDVNLRPSKIILALSLTGLAFIALYKGMMPLYLWIGNPFCFPCIPLRLLIVFPGGIIAMVMTFGPVMGVAENRLLQFAPEVIRAEIGGMASTFFSIGMIFWIIFAFAFAGGFCCWYKVCREGADANVCSLCC